MRDDGVVRTTIDLDPDILLAVKEIAALRATTAGKVLSDLARKALEPAASGGERNGVPLLPRRPHGAPRPTLALVNRLRDEA
ncbi:MAG: CopG family transcriptional regulator [Vicinamibacterales bacterium]